MPRLSQAQDAARRHLVRAAHAGLPPERLAGQILAALERAVPSDGQQLFGVDPATLLFNRLLAASPGMVRHSLWYLRERYLAEPVPALDHPALMRAGHQALALHDRPETSWGAPDDLRREVASADWRRTYHEAQAPAGGVLRAYFSADGRYVASLVLARFAPGSPFRPSEVGFVRLMAPLIARALRLSLEREAGAWAGGRPGASGVLLLSGDRREQVCTPAGRAWLDELRGAEAAIGGALPTAVGSLLAALRAGAMGDLPPMLRVRTPSGVLRLEASPAGGDTVAVVLTPERPPAAPELPATWGLTRQERQVATLVVQGLSNAEIAAALVVSEHTVESHLGHVYAKLDVHGRSQLLGRLFREAYWPALQAGS
jgi:DNA-binding CsgD family transcriptional regulator